MKTEMTIKESTLIISKLLILILFTLISLTIVIIHIGSSILIFIVLSYNYWLRLIAIIILSMFTSIFTIWIIFIFNKLWAKMVIKE